MKKRFFSLVCCFILSFSISTMSVNAISVSASHPQRSMDQNVEYFDDGSYVITEWDVTVPSPHTTASRTKKSTYYSSNDVAIFAVSLTGQFSYTYGSSAKATGQSFLSQFMMIQLPMLRKAHPGLVPLCMGRELCVIKGSTAHFLCR